VARILWVSNEGEKEGASQSQESRLHVEKSSITKQKPPGTQETLIISKCARRGGNRTRGSNDIRKGKKMMDEIYVI